MAKLLHIQSSPPAESSASISVAGKFTECFLSAYLGDMGDMGHVTGKPIEAIYARGGAYGPVTGAEADDRQSAYIRQIFAFIGFSCVTEIFVEFNVSGPEAVEKSRAGAAKPAAPF